jgi:D-lactate dehydrogenase
MLFFIILVHQPLQAGSMAQKRGIFMENIKIAFFDSKPYDILSFDEINKNFNFGIKYFKNRLNPDTAFQTKEHNAVCAFVNDQISKEVINFLVDNGVKIIALRCAGYNNVDLKEIYKRIHVVRVPAYSPYAVAEHAVALMLALNRKIHRSYSRTRDNNFNIDGLLCFDMYGKTAGIIGTGNIGRVLINILKGFGMKILAYNPVDEDKAYAAKTGFEYTGLDRLYAESDIISLHCPLNKDTFHLVNSASIDKMKKGVMIINTGRGQLIDTKELIHGLKTGKVGYAGLDVYEEESEYFFEDFSNTIIEDDVLSRLLTFPNVLVTSHQGFFTNEALHNIAATTMESIKAFFENRQLANEICYKCSGTECRKLQNGRCF